MSESSTKLAVQEPKQKATLAKPTRKRKPVSKAKPVETPAQVAQSPGQSLAQVAVTAARAEGETAKQVYLAEKQVVTTEFFDFIRAEQSASAVVIEDAVLGFHGLTRDDLYEQPQAIEG